MPSARALFRLGAPFFFFLSCALGPAPRASEKSDQAVVEALAGLTAHLVFPEHFQQGFSTRASGDFDVNSYFSVLSRLSMEPGWILDYVYFKDGLGGKPFIYARPRTQPSFATYDEFARAFGGADEHSSPPIDHAREYLEHIRVDGTAEGFFQFVLLSVVGDQFYLYWHGGYNDTRIVCDRRAALAALDAGAKEFNLKIPARVRIQARRINFNPTVEFVGASARVRFVTFSKWGGFTENRCMVGRIFPHALSTLSQKTLVPYECGISF